MSYQSGGVRWHRGKNLFLPFREGGVPPGEPDPFFASVILLATGDQYPFNDQSPLARPSTIVDGASPIFQDTTNLLFGTPGIGFPLSGGYPYVGYGTNFDLSGPFTIEGFFFPTIAAKNGEVLWNFPRVPPSGPLYYGARVHQFGFDYYQGSWNNNPQSATSPLIRVNLNQWNYFCIECPPPATIGRYSINGAYITASTFSARPTLAQNFRFGADVSTGVQFTGSINQFRITRVARYNPTGWVGNIPPVPTAPWPTFGP